MTADALNADHQARAHTLALMTIAAELNALRRLIARVDTPVPFALTRRGIDLLSGTDQQPDDDTTTLAGKTFT